MGDHTVDDMGLSTDRNPTKSPDLVKVERPLGKTGMLERRIVSSSDFP
jgi:hypothetical protein